MPSEVCTACQRNLRFTKKYNCYDCQRAHCSNCIRRGSEDQRRCQYCHILKSAPLFREFLVGAPTTVLKNHAQAKGIRVVKPIAKEDLVSAILQNQVTRLHQQLEAAKLELSQGSVNTSSAMASSLSSVPVVSAGTSSDTVEEEFSMLDGRLLVLPESEGGPSAFQLGRPASGSEGSGGGGGVSDGVGGVNSSDAITLGASSQREKGVVDVGTQTPSNMDTSRSCDSLYTMQLPGQTDSMWRSEETLAQPHIEKRFASGTTPTVDDIDHEDDIRHLSVRQLKMILVRNYVDIKGCVERRELEEKLKQLWSSRKREKEHLAKAAGTLVQDEILCKICMDSSVDCVFLECGHMVTCVQCGKQMNECPICRQYVVRVVRTFRI